VAGCRLTLSLDALVLLSHLLGMLLRPLGVLLGEGAVLGRLAPVCVDRPTQLLSLGRVSIRFLPVPRRFGSESLSQDSLPLRPASHVGDENRECGHRDYHYGDNENRRHASRLPVPRNPNRGTRCVVVELPQRPHRVQCVPQLQLDHVAVAVRSIKSALPLYRDALGGEYLMGGDADGSWRWIQLRFSGGKVELLEPLGEGFLARFLERYGEGLHHITFKTEDIREAIEELERRGYELVDINVDNPDWKEAFLRPSMAHGTLIQVAQSALSDEQARKHLHPSNLAELLGP
jgi:methylmalonyl-CoA/ethylmalonyl-CoA epimerase